MSPPRPCILIVDDNAANRALLEAHLSDDYETVGLGLYLVKLVATAHGGHTLVRDRKGGGTAVGLVVPQVPDA